MAKISKALRTFYYTYQEINPSADKTALYELKEEYWEMIDKVDELEEENRELKEKNRELEEQLKKLKNIEYKDGAYFTYDDDGKRTPPICPKCYDEQGLCFNLEQTNGGARCAVCGSRFPGVTTDIVGYKQRIGII